MDLLDVAHAACDAAARTIGTSRPARSEISHKPDGSIVTELDKRAETTIRSVLGLATPHVDVIGEEGGGALSDRCWIVDPIDGTEHFARGHPSWATLVAYMQDSRLPGAVVAAPELGRRWWARRGEGAFCNGRRITASGVASLSEATLAFGALHDYSSAQQEALIELSRHFRSSWGWGNFWGHVLVAEGVADAALEMGTAVWDVAAPALVVEEAGGRWADCSGGRDRTAGTLVSAAPGIFDGTSALARTLVEPPPC